MMAMSPTRGTLVRDRFTSEVLAGNPLGDPTERDLFVYLPPGYDTSGDRRYPVIFVLAGYSGTGASFVNWHAFEPSLSDRLDALAAVFPGQGELIAVMPDCFTRYGGSQYLNSAATGRYDDYLAHELVPYIDQTYRTLGNGGRGIMGKSSGGYGALLNGIKHPDVWSAVACHSGDMGFDQVYTRDFPGFCNTINREGGVEAWLDGFWKRVKKRGDDFNAISVLAMASCYSPDETQPLGVALPMDTHTSELIPEVWQQWLAHDPLTLIEQPEAQDALCSMKLLFLDCGTRDEFNLHFGARRFTHKLSHFGVPYTYEEFDDTHRDISYRQDVSLPRLAAALWKG